MATRLKSTPAQAAVPVLAGIAFLALLAAALWGIAVWVSSSTGEGSRVDVNLGDDVFNLGQAEKRAQEITDRGPVLFPGLLAAGEGYVVVSHSGTDPLKSWRAFAATPPGAEPRCAVTWLPERQKLVNPCDGTAYPPDGTGLTQFPVSISAKGEVIVDLTPGGTPGHGTPTTTP